MDEREARKMLRARGIELGMDPRSAVEVALAIIETGSPAMKVVEVEAVPEPIQEESAIIKEIHG